MEQERSANQELAQWEGRPERRKDIWYTKIEKEFNGPEPQIGDTVLVRGNRSYGTGAEFSARIMAIRERYEEWTLVLSEGPPWQTESLEAVRAKKTEAALRSVREAEIRQGLGLCVTCGEETEDCRCVRKAREGATKVKEEREAATAKLALVKEVNMHNLEVEQRRRDLTKDIVQEGIKRHHGNTGRVMDELGLVKRLHEPIMRVTGSRLGEFESGRSWLTQWMKRKAPELWQLTVRERERHKDRAGT